MTSKTLALAFVTAVSLAMGTAMAQARPAMLQDVAAWQAPNNYLNAPQTQTFDPQANRFGIPSGVGAGG